MATGGRREFVGLALLVLCAALAACSVGVVDGSRSWRSSSRPSTSGASVRAWDSTSTRVKKTDRPVIGIVTLPVTVASEEMFGTQSFATSYVRFVQAGGARVAPIFYDSTEEELEAILNKVNGVVWTGGIVEFNPSDDEPEGYKYRRTTERILQHVIRENERGNYYPLWGTCLGFERFVELIVGENNASTKESPILDSTDAVDFPINLELTPYGLRSRLFHNLNRVLLNEVTHPDSDIVYNNHELGVHPTHFLNNPRVHSAFKVVATNKDRNGKVFVSTVEGTDLPLYGSQWHPEKSVWEWNPKLHPSHSATAIEFSGYVGRFFVNECKYNGNSFADVEDEKKALIQNWFSYPTGDDSVLSEVYFFWSPHRDVRPSAESAKQLHAGHPALLDLFNILL